MQVFPVPDPRATVQIDIPGLAACCFNAAFTDTNPNRRGRWEVALPRPDDHQLTINLGELGNVVIPASAQLIEIRDRVGVQVDNPKHLHDPFDRKSLTTSDLHDYRWLTDFTNPTEVPHGPVTMKPSIVTKLFVYDATFYTEMEVTASTMIRTPNDKTGLITEDGRVIPAPEYLAGPVLDDLANVFGYVASSIRIDIHAPTGGAGSVDILVDGRLLTNITQGVEPVNISIANLDTCDKTKDCPGGGTVRTGPFEYGRGDFYRYYNLFAVQEPKFHLWARTIRTPDEKEPSSSAEPSRTGDCNGVRVDAFANLNGLTPETPI